MDITDETLEAEDFDGFFGRPGTPTVTMTNNYQLMMERYQLLKARFAAAAARQETVEWRESNIEVEVTF